MRASAGMWVCGRCPFGIRAGREPCFARGKTPAKRYEDFHACRMNSRARFLARKSNNSSVTVSSGLSERFLKSSRKRAAPFFGAIYHASSMILALGRVRLSGSVSITTSLSSGRSIAPCSPQLSTKLLGEAAGVRDGVSEPSRCGFRIRMRGCRVARRHELSRTDG